MIEVRNVLITIYNPNFKVVEFEHFKTEAGLHIFVFGVVELIKMTGNFRFDHLNP